MMFFLTPFYFTPRWHFAPTNSAVSRPETIDTHAPTTEDRLALGEAQSSELLTSR